MRRCFGYRSSRELKLREGMNTLFAVVKSALGAGWISLGPVGHINADSGLGPWRQGLDLLTAFVSGFDRQQESLSLARI